MPSFERRYGGSVQMQSTLSGGWFFIRTRESPRYKCDLPSSLLQTGTFGSVSACFTLFSSYADIIKVVRPRTDQNTSVFDSTAFLCLKPRWFAMPAGFGYSDADTVDKRLRELGWKSNLAGQRGYQLAQFDVFRFGVPIFRPAPRIRGSPPAFMFAAAS